MKTPQLFFAALCACLTFSSLQAVEPGPRQRVEIRILEVEMESLVDVYADVFRDIQSLRTAMVRLEIEAREENEDETNYEASRLERGVHTMERRLNELREEIHMRAGRMEEIHREHQRQMEQREHERRNDERMEEHDRMNEERDRDMQKRERLERDLMEEKRHHDMQERERMEREHMERHNEAIRSQEQRGRDERFDRPVGRKTSGGPGREQEVEVKVFLDGREIDVEIEEKDRKND